MYKNICIYIIIGIYIYTCITGLNGFFENSPEKIAVFNNLRGHFSDVSSKVQGQFADSCGSQRLIKVTLDGLSAPKSWETNLGKQHWQILATLYGKPGHKGLIRLLMKAHEMQLMVQFG